MKIAILQTPTFPLNVDFHGGIERVELGELDTLNRLGHHAVLFVPKAIGFKKGVRVIRDLGWRNRFIKWFYYLNYLARIIDYDVGHGHYTPILLLLYPSKCLVHFHGLAVSELPFYRYRFAKRRYSEAHYIFCSNWVKEEFRKIYPELPTERLHVVYNGVDTNYFKPKTYSKNKNDVVNICWYGVWEEEKGIFDLLEAIKLVQSKRKGFRVLIGGSANFEVDNPKARDIDHRVRNIAGQLETARIVGPIAHGKLAEFLSKQDFGIFPSIYRDPFPLVPLEMMAAGLPVIAYDFGGPREAIVDGLTGFLVENKRPEKLAEEIDYFLDNRDEIERMGKAARAHVEQNFTWERHVNRLLEIYEEITANKK